MHCFEYTVLHAKNFFDDDKTAGKWVRFLEMNKATVLQFGLFRRIFKLFRGGHGTLRIGY